MALCKCYACPKSGGFQIGKYYHWVYSPQTFSGQKGRMVRDINKDNIVFEHQEYSLSFKDIEIANNCINIYIDRKKELIFAPEFKCEIGYHVPLDCFGKVSFPYTPYDIGKEFQEIWEKYKNHSVVSEEERKQTIPYYEIIAKSWGKFASARWMLNVDFIYSENEIIFTYWYKKERNSFGINADDRVIDRVISMSASCEEIGETIIALYEKAGII